ncbi:hypothetical protein AJ78_05577 [Emergomyces pasteurianus Ep9510]|uniref:Uncharacterized protein n=1 Tax=Emergomyces pasteurianus Ep9510 TaxID=1447872 RepID=A0A1J9PDD7_9EURO|nr:hypothetical protein AJ78_05577 [Emergomyces pasteurianus Ep9510]
MPANLKVPRLELIHHIFNRSEIAFVANYSKQTITRIRHNLKAFGNVSAPRNGAERPLRTLTEETDSMSE